MAYIMYFLIGILFVISWSVLWFLIKPRSYFLTIHHAPVSRLKIFFHHLAAVFAILVLMAVVVPNEPNQAATGSELLVFLLGIISTIVFLIYFGKNKINLGKKDNVQP
ncbi:hypothetical protein, partial [Acinetobacter baumannii]